MSSGPRLAILRRKMTSTKATPLSLTVLLLLTQIAPGAETPRQATPHPHIRTTDARLRRLVGEGLRTSDTFRALVGRLHQSDVIVYLECDGTSKPHGGRLTFISSAGGYRYVQVRVSRLRSRDEQIAIIGHELRHAVEIADAPQVVDGPSMAREYARIGYESRRMTRPGVTFDSDAAVRAGYRVLREMGGVMED
jgi:hypothetical protein